MYIKYYWGVLSYCVIVFIVREYRKGSGNRFVFVFFFKRFFFLCYVDIKLVNIYRVKVFEYLILEGIFYIKNIIKFFWGDI